MDIWKVVLTTLPGKVRQRAHNYSLTVRKRYSFFSSKITLLQDVSLVIDWGSFENPTERFRQNRRIFTDSPTKKLKKIFSKETFCFKSCSEPPVLGKFERLTKKLLPWGQKFLARNRKWKNQIEKVFLQGVSLVIARVVSITSPRFSRHTAKTFLLCWSEIKMEEIYIYLKIKFFLQNFPLEPKKAILSAVLKRFFQKAERILLIVR